MELAALLLGGALIFIIVIIVFRAVKIEDKSAAGQGAEPDLYLSRRAAESLSGMIRLRTVVSEAGSAAEFKKLKDYLRMRYPETFATLRTEDVDGNLLLRWNGTDEDADPFLFCANSDVVSADGAWEYAPFSGAIAEEHVWGRGTVESKGVLCSILEAVESLIVEGFVPKRDVYISILRDSEANRTGASEIAELFKKRGIRFTAVFDKGACISKDLLPIARPQAVVGVAEKGYLKVRLSSSGAGGRTAFPPRYTAIGRLSEAVCRLEFRPHPLRNSLVQRDMIESFAPYLPFGMRLFAANLWLLEGEFYRRIRNNFKFASMLRTTFATTDFNAGNRENKLPLSAEAVVHIRTIYGDTCSDIYRYIENLVDSLGVQSEAAVAEDVSQVSPYKGKEFGKLKKALTESLGDMAIAPGIIADHTTSAPYVPYAEAVYRITPFILTEAEKDTIHGTNERVGVDALGHAIDFYRRLLGYTAG